MDSILLEMERGFANPQLKHFKPDLAKNEIAKIGHWGGDTAFNINIKYKCYSLFYVLAGCRELNP